MKQASRLVWLLCALGLSACAGGPVSDFPRGVTDGDDNGAGMGGDMAPPSDAGGAEVPSSTGGNTGGDSNSNAGTSDASVMGVSDGGVSGGGASEGGTTEAGSGEGGLQDAGVPDAEVPAPGQPADWL